VLSIFDLFKIGIGPSSSHTVGPMRAAKRFVCELDAKRLLLDAACLKVELYGSLALTGKGHGTNRAVLLGLSGEDPDRIDPLTIETRIIKISKDKRLNLLGKHAIGFDEEADLIFHKHETLPRHANGMRFTAYRRDATVLSARIFYSIGGGFILAEEEDVDQRSLASEPIPYPFSSAEELLGLGKTHQKLIWELVLANEEAHRTRDDVINGVFRLWGVMQDCILRGLRTEGILPGGLNVRRRAPNIYSAIADSGAADPLSQMDWVSLFAIAVNEENAAGNRVVTAPTNGAAGVIPAVVQYYTKFVRGAEDEGILRFFLTAGAIGHLYKLNASISAAEVGCQGEIGVACSMAAAGLVAALRGSNEQIEHAAEIAMEHTLGMSCDPVAGLVQIPCIERNAFGAVKAICSTRMAMIENSEHKVSLDQVIRTMLQTGRDMQARYKETSLGGLAVNVIEC